LVRRTEARHGRPAELIDVLILYRWQDALGQLDRDPASISARR